MNEKYKQQIELYSDGEMNKDEESRFAETLRSFPDLQDYLNKIENQKELLKQWWNSQKHN